MLHVIVNVTIRWGMCTAVHMNCAYVQQCTCIVHVYSSAHALCICTVVHMHCAYVQQCACFVHVYSSAHALCMPASLLL